MHDPNIVIPMISAFLFGIIGGLFIMLAIHERERRRQPIITDATNTGPSPQQSKKDRVYKYENGTITSVFICS